MGKGKRKREINEKKARTGQETLTATCREIVLDRKLKYHSVR